MDEALKATVVDLDVIDGMVYVMALLGYRFFPYRFNDLDMMVAFQRLFEDIDELFLPHGARNDCGPIYLGIHGTSGKVERMLNFAIYRTRLLNLDPISGEMPLNCSAGEASNAFSRRQNLPGNQKVYEELVNRFRRYYDEARASGNS